MKVWRNSRPSCVFDVTPSGDLAPYFKCVVRVAQQDGNEEDQVADVKVTYEVKKVSGLVLPATTRVNIRTMVCHTRRLIMMTDDDV